MGRNNPLTFSGRVFTPFIIVIRTCIVYMFESFVSSSVSLFRTFVSFFFPSFGVQHDELLLLYCGRTRYVHSESVDVEVYLRPSARRFAFQNYSFRVRADKRVRTMLCRSRNFVYRRTTDALQNI